MTTVPRREQAQRRRAQLLDVALQAFVDDGIENVSMADLAARAGVAHGLVYHYFASKDELVLAVMAHASPLEHFSDIAADMHGMPVQDGLRLFGERLAALLEQRRDVVRFVLRETLSPRSELPARLAELQARVLDGLGEYLTERVEAGELRPHDVRAPLRMLISSALVLGVTGQPVAPAMPGLIDTVLSGIRCKESS